MNNPIRITANLFGWLTALLLIFIIIMSCSWFSLLGARSVLEEDTRSKLSADYSAWTFVVFQPVNLSIIEAIESDRGESIDLAPNEVGDGWYYGTPIPTKEAPPKEIGGTSTATPIPSSTATVKATETATFSASATFTQTPTSTFTLSPTSTIIFNTPIPPSKTPKASKTPVIDNTKKPTWTPTNTPTATNTPVLITIHIGDLDGSSVFSNIPKTIWEASVTIMVHDEDHNPVEDVKIFGDWTLGGSGNCFTTDAAGICTNSRGNINVSNSVTTYSISDILLTGYTYDIKDNHDPDGCETASCNSITVNMPSGSALGRVDTDTNTLKLTGISKITNVSANETPTNSLTLSPLTASSQNERIKALLWMPIFTIPLIFGVHLILPRGRTKN